MLTGWLSDGTNKYYMDPGTGKMSRTLKEINGAYYYFNNAGHMLTGWIQVNGKYYYLEPATGKLVSGGSFTIDGKSYTFGADGVCQNASGVSAPR